MGSLRDRLAAGDIVLIDGATGTELERLGVPMREGAWCGDVVRTHPDVLRAVHEAHIAAGAELIITNTFATHRHLLAFGGIEQHFELLNRRSVEVALEARDRAGNPDVAVAASMSTSRQGGTPPPLAVARDNFAEQAEILAAAGADLFVLEMMRDLDETQLCIDAAAATGLPIWLGWSCVAADRPEPLLYEKAQTLRQGMAAIEGQPIDVVAIMHTEVEEVDACLDVLDETWDGPVGVYAHSGDFVPPNWIFNDIISADDYCAHCLRWVARGVQVVGGCCGITDAHIAVLRDALAAR